MVFTTCDINSMRDKFLEEKVEATKKKLIYIHSNIEKKDIPQEHIELISTRIAQLFFPKEKYPRENMSIYNFTIKLLTNL